MEKPPTYLARADWVAACGFTPYSEAEVLSQLSIKIKQNKDLGVRSFVLLDLDSTLYEVAPRTVRIYQEAARELVAMPLPVQQALATTSQPATGYSLEDTWEKLGLCWKNPEFHPAQSALRAFWRERFFSNAYLEHDIPYPGTAEFAHQLHILGGEIVYLTGRDEPGMREGTLRNLERDGFPMGPNTHLRMKASREGEDIPHKVGTALTLQKEGEVIASFENEPRNFAALAEALPHCLHVFVDTICSDQPAPIVRGAYHLRRFRA